ncbi:ABC transporter permease [Entomospira culicis]|uniref:ABC transporter permease n=1 Tax=Entomospira culicis TaxID=2719989 RepID=A0A968KWD8_9SPIO|nr:ABC transporter permease [Entomospira culicis]NIZ19895.1 ABC transporter permease [Entomospira culicis]NIZ70148.1 ABC transporter permease [Entomospira culicis]WDI38075.1 ABC transporter permease [Entomospira culicis]WDI39698.1 ABC transporter permease [Entomospira culicis]
MKIGKILTQLLWSLAVLFVVVSATFFLLQILPGDPVKMMMGERVNPEVLAQIREQMGLNKPLIEQYIDFWQKIFQLDFGRSYQLKMPVTDLVAEASVVTLKLAFYSIIIAVVGGLLIGVTAAIYRGTWVDNLLMSFAVLNISTPSFWFALMLQLIFGLWLGWLPISGYRTPMHFVLPAFALGLRYMASLARLTRTSMLEVLSSEYLLAAKAKGVGNLRLIWVHAFGNALLPIMTFIGGSLADMLAGAMLIEQIFGLPGVGRLTISSLLGRDLPLLQATVIYLTVISVGIYLLVDWLAMFIDPRVRMKGVRDEG